MRKPYLFRSLQEAVHETKEMIPEIDDRHALASAEWKVALCGAAMAAAGTAGFIMLAESAGNVATEIRSENVHEMRFGLDDVTMVGLSPLILPLSGLAIYGGAGFASIAAGMERRRQELVDNGAY